MFHFFTTQNLLLAGVFAHLFLTTAKLVFKTPKQQAQIDGLGDKLDTVLSEVQTVAQVVTPPAPNNGGVGQTASAPTTPSSLTLLQSINPQGGS